MKIIGRIAGGAMALGLCAASAQAAVVYTYTGNAFSDTLGTYDTSQRVTGSFTVDDLLTQQLITVYPTEFSFSDGGHQITNLTTSYSNFFVQANSNGEIDRWQILVGTGTQGFISTSAGIGFELDIGQLDGSRTGYAYNQSRRGTWTVSTVNPPPTDPPVSSAPEPAAWALMLLGFGGLGAALRRRRATVTV